MRTRIFLGAIVLVCTVCRASAAGYDHFAIGLAANNRGDYGTAITEFTAALAAGDLSSGLVPIAYLQRSKAFIDQKKCAEAAADAASALKVRPGFVEALEMRAYSNSCLGNYRESATDYLAAFAIKPAPRYLMDAGIRYWMDGDFKAAQDQFQKAIDTKSLGDYVVLWLEIMRLRGGNPDIAQMARDASDLDSRDWPAPVFDLYLGKIGPDQLMTLAASNRDAIKAANNQCEASFYIAEWHLAQNQAALAWPLLETARKNCPEGFYEHTLADAELKHSH